MGYLFLGIALLSGIIRGYCGKKTSTLVNTLHDSLLLNTTRMLLCIVIGFFFAVFSEDGISLSNLTWKAVFISLLSGISLASFVVTWIFSVQRGTYMMIEISLLVSTLIPIVVCRIIYSEQISLLQWIGFGILVIATYIMTVYNRSQNGKMTFGSIILLASCAVFNGCADLSQKIFVHEVKNLSASVFNFYTYIAAFFVLLTVLLITGKNRKDVKTSGALLKNVFPYMLVMAVCLFANSFFKTLAAAKLPSAVLYPLMQGLKMILSLAMSSVFFKEKVTTKCIFGIVLAFAALILMNF